MNPNRTPPATNRPRRRISRPMGRARVAGLPGAVYRPQSAVATEAAGHEGHEHGAAPAEALDNNGELRRGPSSWRRLAANPGMIWRP